MNMDPGTNPGLRSERDLNVSPRRVGAHALQRLHEMQERYPIIGNVRGLGLLLGVDLVQDRKTRARAADEAEQVMYSALSKGLNFKVTMGNILALTPPLTITTAEMDRALDILDACFREITP